jgi:hypothetical protein
VPEPWFFDVLPSRPPPYPDEALSGYLLRLADANGFPNLWAFTQDLFPVFTTPIQTRLLGWEYPVASWGRIPLRAQLSLDQLRRLTVVAWAEKFERDRPVERPGTLSPAHFLRGAVRQDLRVCPECLKEAPYIRLVWRLSPVEMCLRHKRALKGRCDQCGSELTPAAPTQRHIRCGTCGADLRSLRSNPAPRESLALQQRILTGLQFMLDSDTALTSAVQSEPNRAVGLRLRYVRECAGLSEYDIGQRAGICPDGVRSLEVGTRVELGIYVQYLAALSLSWQELTSLEIPEGFAEPCRRGRHVQLRVCPA